MTVVVTLIFSLISLKQAKNSCSKHGQRRWTLYARVILQLRWQSKEMSQSLPLVWRKYIERQFLQISNHKCWLKTKEQGIESLNGEYWGSTKLELKLLGVTLDEQLRFTTHISNVCRKVLSVWNQEYKNCNKSVTKNYYVRLICILGRIVDYKKWPQLCTK